MEQEQAFSQEQLQEADTQGQQEAQQVEMPEEKYAGLGSWAARKIIKSASPKEATDAISSDLIYQKYNIEKPKETEQPLQEVSSPVVTKELRPLDGKDVIEPTYSFDTEAEAVGLAKSNLSDYDADDSFQMNFDTLQVDTKEDVGSIIGAMAEMNKGKIDEARRGVVSDELMRGLADDLGQSPEFLQEVLSRKEGEMFPAEKILAIRQTLERSAMTLKKLAKEIASSKGEASQETRHSFQRQFQFHQDFQTQFMGARAEYGRGMRAMGVPTGTEEANIDMTMEMLTSMERGLDIDTMAASIDAAENVSGVGGVVDAMARSKTNVAFDSLYEVYVNSILSGFKTHIVNFAGSKLRLWVDVVDTAVAARMGGGDVSDAEKVAIGEWKASMFAQNIVAAESMKVAWATMKSGDAYKGISKMETTERRSIDSAVYAQTFGLDPDGMFAGVVDWIGNTVRAPTERLMGGTDAFMRHQGERVHIIKAAYREAQHLAEVNNLGEEQTMELLQDLIENPTEKIREEATDFASAVTFQSPLGKQGRDFQKWVAKTPGMRYIFPFVKTPVNLLKQGFLERTPLGLFSKKMREDLAAGGARAQMAKSKMATGTALASFAYMAAQSGKITGSEPEDRDVALARREAGWRPRSIVVDNPDGSKQYISYDRMEPFSYIIGAVADYHAYLDETQYDILGEEDDARNDRMASALVIAFAENTLNKTFMTGMRDIMNVWTDPKRYGSSYIDRTLNAFIPYSGARRDLTRLMDGTKRLNETTADYIKANSILWSSELPPRRDNFGNEIEYDTVLNPWASVTEDDDYVYAEIGRLANSTKRAPIPKGNKKLKGIDMSPVEYDKFIKLSRKELLINGNTFREAIESIINMPEYETVMDDDKVDQLVRVARSYDEKARAQMAEEDATIMEKLQRRTFIKAAKRNAMQNGTDEQVELDNLKELYGSE